MLKRIVKPLKPMVDQYDNQPKHIMVANNTFARFLGWEISNDVWYHYHKQTGKLLHSQISGNDRAFHREQLCFHVSWDWLNLVIEKLETMTNKADHKYIVSVEGKGCRVLNADMERLYHSDRLWATYNALYFVISKDIMEPVEWEEMHHD